MVEVAPRGFIVCSVEAVVEFTTKKTQLLALGLVTTSIIVFPPADGERFVEEIVMPSGGVGVGTGVGVGAGGAIVTVTTLDGSEGLHIPSPGFSFMQPFTVAKRCVIAPLSSMSPTTA